MTDNGKMNQVRLAVEESVLSRRVKRRSWLSNSVSKKGGSILAWAMMMPNNSCPFASEVCKRLCYTFVGNFPLQDGRHEENYEFSKTPLFVEAITEEIFRFARENKSRDVAVAIHERGEFYTLEYLAKWAEIILATRRIGNLSYFIYTRSWRNPKFRDALERLVSDNAHVRVNLSLDSDMVTEFGVPRPIGEGKVVYLAETDNDLPPDGVSLVLRNLRIRHDKPMERIGGVLVCPNESGMYVAKRQGEPSLQKGMCKRIQCQYCRLCIDRSEAFWDATKHRYLGTPGEEPVQTPASTPPATETEYLFGAEDLHLLLPSDLEETCCPTSEEERNWNDKIDRAVTRFQSTVIETCLDAADHGVTIAPFTRDRMTNTAIVIYQFANKVLLPKEVP